MIADRLKALLSSPEHDKDTSETKVVAFRPQRRKLRGGLPTPPTHDPDDQPPPAA